MGEHTKLPWYFDQFDIFDDKGVVCKKPVVAENAANWPTNAAFIVKAVNNHVEMDQLLAEAADFLNYSPTIDGMDLGAKITAFRLRLQKGISAAVEDAPGSGK